MSAVLNRLKSGLDGPHPGESVSCVEELDALVFYLSFSQSESLTNTLPTQRFCNFALKPIIFNAK